MVFDYLQKYVTGNLEISKSLLWEYDLSRFDYNDMRGIVVQRIIERGTPEDYYAAFKMYGGIEGFKKIIREEVRFLTPKDMSFVCVTFDLKKENLDCYKRKLRREQFLNSPPTERETEILCQLEKSTHKIKAV